ncbi:MAG TPA: glycosyltransferase family 39 protein [Kofleriaceae bacterium]|nr:glycosyltransferase family 39 protein [Kofleriaceae bacterium]
MKLPERWIHRGLAAALFLAAFVSVIWAQREHGVVRDEDVYMNAGSRYAGWYLGLFTGDSGTSPESIRSHFGGPRVTDNNREHPALMKTLFGLSERVLHRSLGLTSSITGYRVPTALVNALLVLLVFLLVASVWGRAEAIAAALLTLLLPRAFFHAGLATFDAPIAALWFAVLYAYFRTLASRRWLWGLGAIFGCALATKHNAILLPVALAVHYAWLCVRGARAGKPWWGPRPSLWLGLLVVGPVVFMCLWPWLWFDTADHIRDWLGFHFHHIHYNYEYLGHNYNHAPYPWHAPIVTTLFTVPVITLAAGALGAGLLIWRARHGQAAEPERAPALLLLLSAGVAMGPFLLRSQPIFGAEKHWAAAIPTIAIYAGIGLVWAARLAAERLAAAGLIPTARLPVARTAAVAALITLAGAAALTETAAAQPYALSHYNALAGGAPGGADLGMNRQFWGYAARGVLPYLNEQAASGPVELYAHDADMTFGAYRRDGLVSPRVKVKDREDKGVHDSGYAIVVHELHFNRHDYMIWKDYGTVQPVFVLRFQGVPIVTVYRRPPAGR